MNQEMKQWRAELFATGNFDKEQLEELEDHLLDEIDHIDSTSLSPEEKLMIAKQRIGTASELKKAYGKDRWISPSHLSWGIQILMAYFVFRDLTISLNWIGGDLSRSLGLENSLYIYAFSVGIQAVGILSFFFFIRYVVRLNYRLENAVKPGLIMAGTCLLMSIIKIACFNIIEGPQIVIESFMVTQVISFLPYITALLAMLWIGLNRLLKNQKVRVAK